MALALPRAQACFRPPPALRDPHWLIVYVPDLLVAVEHLAVDLAIDAFLLFVTFNLF
jgi:hypothetical protein